MIDARPTLDLEENFSGRRIAIVASLWNRELVDQMIEKGVEALRAHGVEPDDISVSRVPGAFELPFAARGALARGLKKRDDLPNAVIAYGVIVRGETPHFDFISQACADGLIRVGLGSGRPAIFGVLTTDNLEQATVRAPLAGADAAQAALYMLRHRFSGRRDNL